MRAGTEKWQLLMKNRLAKIKDKPFAFWRGRELASPQPLVCPRVKRYLEITGGSKNIVQ